MKPLSLLVLFLILAGCNMNTKHDGETKQLKDSTKKSPVTSTDSVKHKTNAERVTKACFKNGTIDSVIRTYFESGKLKSEYYFLNDDSLVYGIKITRIEKTYYETGGMDDECYGSKDNQLCDILRCYYPNGNLRMIQSDFRNLDGQPAKVKEYSDDGQLIQEQIVDFLPLLSAEQSEFNHPQIQHEKYYKNGKLSATGDFFDGCAECGEDSVGIWRIYDDKGQYKTRKYKSYKEDYHK
jgi:antitoxin component YwqK of YwqJK toxin-antitoxin module